MHIHLAQSAQNRLLEVHTGWENGRQREPNPHVQLPSPGAVGHSRSLGQCVIVPTIRVTVDRGDGGGVAGGARQCTETRWRIWKVWLYLTCELALLHTNV